MNCYIRTSAFPYVIPGRNKVLQVLTSLTITLQLEVKQKQRYATIFMPSNNFMGKQIFQAKKTAIFPNADSLHKNVSCRIYKIIF